jgi:hypothetical protein
MPDKSELQLDPYLNGLNPDGGLPYAPGMPSFSEPTLLMTMAFIAANKTKQAQPLIEWILKTRNPNGSIGLSREFPREGIWNTSLLAIVMHQLGRQAERDAAVEFILRLKSIQLNQSQDNDINTRLVGWPWVPGTFGWVEPTAWALLSLTLAKKADHPRAREGFYLLEDRCIPGGGWNYGNRVVFGHTLMPFWDTSALALLALGDRNPDLTKMNLDFLEKSLPEIHSLLSAAFICLCFSRFGRRTEEIRNRLKTMLENTEKENQNFAHSALALTALAQKRVLTP